MMLRSALVIGVLLSAAALPRSLPIKSGLELGNLDLSVRPQDDLYRYVNGRWLATAEIPTDRVTSGFSIAWAAMWRLKVRDGYLRQWLLTLPHAPYEYRANGAVSHLPGFYEAFGVSAGDGLFRPPASRARVW